jgi:nucleotide-binding universal stress UspA family protein
VRRLIAEHNARERLQGLLAPLPSSLDVTSYVTRGRPSAVILSHSEQHRSDLIVMGAPPASRFGDGSGGTVAPVATAASCAVLSVRSETANSAVCRILLPVGAPFADVPATSWAIALASRFAAEVDVLRVGPSGSAFWRVLTAQSRAKQDARVADMQLRAQSELALSRMRSAQVKAREIEQPEHTGCDAITALAEAGAFDLIILGLHAHAGVASGGEELVTALRRRTGVAVLSVRAPRVRSAFASGGFPAVRAQNEVGQYGVSA